MDKKRFQSAVKQSAIVMFGIGAAMLLLFLFVAMLYWIASTFGVVLGLAFVFLAFGAVITGVIYISEQAEEGQGE